MNSLQGTFLVAAPHQLDPNFVKATVLVVAHTVRGALGIIVNDCRAGKQLLPAARVSLAIPAEKSDSATAALLRAR